MRRSSSIDNPCVMSGAVFYTPVWEGRREGACSRSSVSLSSQSSIAPCIHAPESSTVYVGKMILPVLNSIGCLLKKKCCDAVRVQNEDDEVDSKSKSLALCSLSRRAFVGWRGHCHHFSDDILGRSDCLY